MKTYYVYITTNAERSAFYTGFTNNLEKRLQEHYEARGNPKSHAGKYHCYYLVFYEEYNQARDGILREKQIKRWNRQKKINLICSVNPLMEFLEPPRKYY